MLVNVRDANVESDSSSVSHIVRFIISFLSFYCIFGTMTIVRAILQFNWLAAESCSFTVMSSSFRLAVHCRDTETATETDLFWSMRS